MENKFYHIAYYFATYYLGQYHYTIKLSDTMWSVGIKSYISNER